MQFKDVIGQHELKQHLIREARAEKVSHAQLFLGKAGYGTLPVALAFVQYLFCQDRSETDSCGVCASCRKVQSLQHPDLHFSFPLVLPISKTSGSFLKDWREQIAEQPYFSLNDWTRRIDPKERQPVIGTDESQEIIKKLSLKSYEGGFKVMLIWMAGLMNATCSNKLLKILEEPPPRTLFILVSETQETLLQTIISRTQIVKVPRIQLEDLSAYLRTNFNSSAATADSIAARADGDLLEVLEEMGDHVEQDQNRELFINLMRVCYKKDVLAMINWSEQVTQLPKEGQKVFLRYALHMFRQSMLRNYTEDQLTRTSEEEDNFLKNFARFITGNNIFDFMQVFDDACYHLERNANARILFTNICFKVMRFIHFA